MCVSPGQEAVLQVWLIEVWRCVHVCVYVSPNQGVCAAGEEGWFEGGV
jgi:hypothetical protein